MQLWFTERKSQVPNFWNEFFPPGKVLQMKTIHTRVNMLWKLELETHIIGIKTSNFLFFISHGTILYFSVQKTTYSSCHHPTPLGFFFPFVYNYTSCLANDIQTLMALKVTLNAMGCPNKKYFNFLLYDHSNFLSQKFDTLLFPHVRSWDTDTF